MVVALLSSSSEKHAILAVCVGLIAMLVAIQLMLAGERAKLRPLITASILAALLCLAAGVAATAWLLLVAITFCVLDAATTAVALHSQSRTYPRKLPGLRPRQWGRGATLTFTASLLLLIGAGVTFGTLVVSGGGSEPTGTVAISSPYRVSGTCVNGACTVNECKTAAPCGKENKGELREGMPLDIVCQVEGDPATAPNGSRSQIWDRLESGLYISDLFVEGTATGRFTSNLLECTEA